MAITIGSTIPRVELTEEQKAHDAARRAEWAAEYEALRASVYSCEHPIMKACARLLMEIETAVPDDDLEHKQRLFMVSVNAATWQAVFHGNGPKLIFTSDNPPSPKTTKWMEMAKERQAETERNETRELYKNHSNKELRDALEETRDAAASIVLGRSSADDAVLFDLERTIEVIEHMLEERDVSF